MSTDTQVPAQLAQDRSHNEARHGWRYALAV